MHKEHDPELILRLEDAISSLPRLQRHIFVAHRVNDLCYDAIARRSGLTVKQVKRQMAKAICNIDRRMRGEQLSFSQRLKRGFSTLCSRRMRSTAPQGPVDPERARTALERSMRRNRR